MVSQMQIRSAPHSKESEMLVLGHMLTNQKSFNLAIKILEEIDFYFTEHRLIYNALKSIHKSEKVADIHIVCEELKRQNHLTSIGGVQFIVSLSQYAGTSIYIEEYINTLKSYSQMRQLINLGQRIENKVLDNEDPHSIIIEALEQIKLIEKHKAFREKFSFQFLNERSQNFLETPPSKKPMLLDYANSNSIPQGFLPKSIVAMIVGAGGIGKTHLLAQLAISIATGTPWLGTFTPTEHCGKGKKGNIFLGLGENQDDDIHRILYKASKNLRKKQIDSSSSILEDASRNICAFSFCGQQASFLEQRRPSRYFRELKMRLEDKAPQQGWSLIILDPVSRFLGSDAESDNAAATQFIALLEELVIDLPGNPTVLFAHHMSKSAIKNAQENKTDQTAARGSSALTDGVRWQINAFKGSNPNEMILSMQKSNFTAFVNDLHLIKDSEGFLERNYPTPTIELAKEQISRKNNFPTKKLTKEPYSKQILNS